MPLVARASDTDVQTLLNKMLGLRAVDFTTDDASNLSPYGLTSPTATISVTIKSGDTSPDEDMVLQVGGPVPNKPDQVYAQRLKSNSVFTLARSGVDELLRAVPNVRDRHVLPFRPGSGSPASLMPIGTKNGAVPQRPWPLEHHGRRRRAAAPM